MHTHGCARPPRSQPFGSAPGPSSLPAAVRARGKMAARTGEALLAKCSLIWIGRDEKRFAQFLESDNVKALLPRIKQAVKHPDPCFPKTWTDPQTGRRVITAVELGDCMSDECWKKSMAEHASCGALQSHRRAWHIADLMDRTAWCMPPLPYGATGRSPDV